ncbi:MAG: hypothetical protein MUO43_14780 [Desulfobacterales bacterium]|nr:hypothetical protein [Desulfobacterales bacterium]
MNVLLMEDEEWFDLWANSRRNRRASGDVVMLRFARDMLLGFQYRHEAMRFHSKLKGRFRRFNLEINIGKTSLIEFGRYAVERRKERGEGKPETFDFLGFTHICSKSKRGKFMVLRKTSVKKMRNKLQELKRTLRERLQAGAQCISSARWDLYGVRLPNNFLPTHYPLAHSAHPDKAQLQACRPDAFNVFIG